MPFHRFLIRKIRVSMKEFFSNKVTVSRPAKQHRVPSEEFFRGKIQSILRSSVITAFYKVQNKSCILKRAAIC